MEGSIVNDLTGVRLRSRLHSYLEAAAPHKEHDSHKNTAEIKSDNTEIVYQKHGVLKGVTLQQGRNIVHDIIDDVLEKKGGTVTLSESWCPIDEDMRESMAMDPRLKHWHDTLQNRAAVQAKIQRRLGRRPHEMLINSASMAAPRDRATVERLLDLAGRMNPTTLVQKKPGVLPEQVGCDKCRFLPQLQETLPLPERSGQAELEVSGLPGSTKREILGAAFRQPEKSSQWLKSRQLAQHIERKSGDIKRVLDFLPEVDQLEVVGGSFSRGYPDQHPIERLSDDTIFSVSSSSQVLEQESKEDRKEDTSPELDPANVTPKAAVKINGVLYFNSGRRCLSPEIANISLECHPYQKVVKEVARVENVGRQVLTCQWSGPECKRNPKSVAHCQDSLLLSLGSFTVFPGEEQVCRVLFRPRGCYLHKQRFELRIFPNVIGTVRTVFVARVSGRCVPAPEYTAKLRRNLSLVTDKSKKRLADELLKGQASLVPLLHPPEVVCPYEYPLDEREVFNAENPGYHCERFDDLETLKALYEELKKPREPAWDLRLETILKVILRLSDSNQRKLHYAKLVDVQEALKQIKGSLTHFPQNEERMRSRFIYVRGCIGNGIQEWEEAMASMELSGLRLEINRFQVKEDQKMLSEMLSEDEDRGSEGSEPRPWMRKLRRENLHLYLLKKLRSRKSFRDSLYMQTYSHLCDMAEDVVSVIESTQCA